LVASFVSTRPLVAARPVVAHADLVRDRLALDDERTPPVEHEVVDLADARPTVVLGLIRVDEPQIVEDQQADLGREIPMQIEGHLALGLCAGAVSRV
jgi:hypothetical protein